MGHSIALGLYLAASRFAGGYARRVLNRRLAAGKENPDRIEERMGIAARPRPEGQLIWFHAASVGESLSLLDLIKGLLDQHPGLHILLTTGTTTSAELAAQRLPDRAFHQFVPVDAAVAVRRFLDHWRPDVAVWTESELWPTMMHLTHASGCPMLLINARVSAKSARRLRWLGSYSASLFNRFKLILAQDDAGADRIYRLGASPKKIQVTGSLKDTAQPLPHDPDTFKILSKELGSRTVWLAASTHEGEEMPVADAHRHARRQFHGLLLILVPRHPDRGPAIARALRDKGWFVSIRSKGEQPDRNTDIYLADTLGELGLWYRLAPVSFVGGSLVDVGGHNPFEPALLGSAILYGPEVYNFETAYSRFSRAGAAVRVPSAEDLGPVLVETLPADKAAALATAAWSVSSEGADVKRQVMGLIGGYLPPAAQG